MYSVVDIFLDLEPARMSPVRRCARSFWLFNNVRGSRNWPIESSAWQGEVRKAWSGVFRKVRSCVLSPWPECERFSVYPDVVLSRLWPHIDSAPYGRFPDIKCKRQASEFSKFAHVELPPRHLYVDYKCYSSASHHYWLLRLPRILVNDFRLILRYVKRNLRSSVVWRSKVYAMNGSLINLTFLLARVEIAASLSKSLSFCRRCFAFNETRRKWR